MIIVMDSVVSALQDIILIKIVKNVNKLIIYVRLMIKIMVFVWVAMEAIP